jgi:hypothetical protein
MHRKPGAPSSGGRMTSRVVPIETKWLDAGEVTEARVVGG